MRLQYLLIAGTLVLFFMVVALMKYGKLETKYSIIWLAFSRTLILFAFFPQIVFILGDVTRVKDPVHFIFMIQIIFILLILISVSAVISGFSNKIKKLAQTNALLEKRVRELEQHINLRTEKNEDEGTAGE